MMPTAPTYVSALMMICRRPRCSTSETLSRSFVARDSVSPGWCASKYDSGSLAIFEEICWRRLRLRRSAKLAMTSVWML